MRALEQAEAQLRAQVEGLERQIAQVVAASESSNADDEHDPEGATIAFERAQLGALLDHARGRLDSVRTARAVLGSGGYGTCEGCGLPIDPARLQARPDSLLCVRCARAAGPRR